jgi:hypothetical protein
MQSSHLPWDAATKVSSRARRAGVESRQIPSTLSVIPFRDAVSDIRSPGDNSPNTDRSASSSSTSKPLTAST